MKAALLNFLFIFMVLVSGVALSKTPSTDAYARCMARTKNDRLNCQAGCGMIVQQCYDEGVADINNQIVKLSEDIKGKSAVVCADLVENYLNEASRMEANVGKQTKNFVGWTGSELTLNFARQRLDNILLIRKSCN
ncbi:hypothetical protein [Paraburkholderia kururiensis]|uniref:Lysozyme inhibitor LprI N-terminal domain-containing protein n=1 Tax=Paraburkholderia kururiensis TaxID=984307 RepID=A0ABZ0WRZ3_9BURK|nr:hypothetical protein [Paraburkholderia kururiensis]WQD80005.1 hypothetical protein U0042_10145 [Paraburkholderia kururiensis]